MSAIIMFPFLMSTRFISLNIIIKAPIDKVLDILHDPHALLSLSPLIIKTSSNPSDSSYTVTERLGFLGYFHTTTSFWCTLSNRDDGVETNVIAGGGTHIRGIYRVRPGEVHGTSVVTDQATVKGLVFFMPYIIQTMTQAHIRTLSNLANQVEHAYSRSPQPQMTKTALPRPSRSLTLFHVLGVLFGVACARVLWTGVGYTFTLIMIIGAMSIFYGLHMGSDPYGMFHLALNHLPGQDPTIPPQTEWLNMGFWKDTAIFPQACRALALKLFQAARCKRGDRVLDVGHGTGESLLLLLSDSLIRPSSLTGITSIPDHHRRARDRVKQFQDSSDEPSIDVSLHACDAIFSPTAINHPLDPVTDQVFDTVLALDCAYHFHTRKMFLDQSFEKLAPGGRIGLADICFDSSTSNKAWLISLLIGMIPKYNLTSAEDYILDMREIGYIEVQLDDITEDVFPGFITFLKGRGWGWWAFGTILRWYVNAGARFVIVCGSKAL